MPTDFFAFNRGEDMDKNNVVKNIDDLKTPTVITLDSCDTKTVSF